MDGSPGHCGGSHQGQQQLHKIGDHHRPETSSHGVDEHHHSHHRQQQHGVGEPTNRSHRPIGHDAQRFHHFAHGQKGIADANAVHRQRQKKSLDTPQPGRRSTAVAQLGEGSVSHDATAAPKRCEDHRHRHVSQAKAPPFPVASQTTRAHKAGHIQRRIDREGGGRHRGTRQPTIEASTRNEVVVFALVASCQPEPEHQGAEQVRHEDQPVDPSHGPMQVVAVSLSSPDLACFVSAIDRRQRFDPNRDWHEGSLPRHVAPKPAENH